MRYKQTNKKKKILSSSDNYNTVKKKKKKRIVSPFGLYAVLSAISYKLCVRYCDMISRSNFFVFFFSSFLFFFFSLVACVRDVYARTRSAYIEEEIFIERLDKLRYVLKKKKQINRKSNDTKSARQKISNV